MIELVGQRHQQVSPDSRLDILFGDIFIETGEEMTERRAVAVEQIGYGQDLEAAAAAPGQGFGILQRFLGTVG